MKVSNAKSTAQLYEPYAYEPLCESLGVHSKGYEDNVACEPLTIPGNAADDENSLEEISIVQSPFFL